MSGAGRPVARLLALGALLLVVWLALRHSGAGDAYRPERLATWLQQGRDVWWMPALFVAAYVAACALAVPGTALTLAGGAVFGLWRGVLLNYVGAVLGASVAFWIARRLGRDGVRALAGGRLGGLDRIVARRGFVWLLRLRLIPLVPFNALNFGAGLTAMTWRDYVTGTALGIIPGVLVYTFFADALVAGAREASRMAAVRLAAAGALLVALTVVPDLVRRGRAGSGGASPS